MVFPNEVVALPDPAVASDLVDGPTFQDKLVAQVGPYKPVVEALQAHGLTLPTRTLAKTGAYTMVPGDGTVLADATGGAFAVTLPPHLNGRLVRVEKVDASGNAVTVLPGLGTVGGAANDPLEARWHGATYQSDGTNWTVVARAVPRGTYVGTLGVSNGVNDTAAVNAILTAARLAGRGQVKGSPGETYLLDGPMVVGSGTTLDLTGCTVTAISGWTGNNLIVNYAAVTPQRTVADAATVADDNTISSAAADFVAADVGRSVVIARGHVNNGLVGIAGAMDPGAIDVFTSIITSVAGDGSTAEVREAPSATISGMAMSIYDRDTDITLIGGAVERPNVGAPAFDTRIHTVRLRRIDRLKVQDMRIDTLNGKYALSLADVTRFTVDNINFDSFSDGVHLTGPARFGKISRIFGITHDDYVAIGCGDYPGLCDTQGSITDIEVEGLFPDQVAGTPANGLNLFGGTGQPFELRRISAKGLYGRVNASMYRVAQVDPATVCDNLTVSDIHPVANGTPQVMVVPGTAMVSGTNAIGNLTINGLHYDSSSETVDIVRIGAGASVRRLVVDGIVLTGPVPTEGVVKVEGSCASLTVRGGDVAIGPNSTLVSLSTGGCVLSRLVLDDMTVVGTPNTSSIVMCAAIDQPGLVMSVSDMKASGFTGTYPFWLAGTVTLNLSDVDLGPCYQSIYLGTAVTTCRVRGSGFRSGYTAAAQVGGTAGATLNSSTFDFAVDLTSALVGAVVGDRAYNTEATHAAGVGPVTYAGAWRQANDASATLDAAFPVSGEYVTPSRTGTTVATKAQDNAFWMWLPLAADGTLDRIGIEVTTAVAASTYRLGLYAPGGDGRPGARLLDAGTVDCSAIGLAETAISRAVTRPGVWLCAVRQGVGSPEIRVGITTHQARFSRTAGLVVTQYALDCFSTFGVSGALPNPAPGGLLGDTTAPLVVVRFA